MSKLTSTVILFCLGLLISASSFSQDVVLTNDNYVILSGPVTDNSVSGVAQKLGQLSAKLPAGAVVYLVLDTPGGSVMAGSQLADFGKSLPLKIKPVCLFCASMGYHLFQSFDERIVQSSSTLMSHRASLGGVSGQIPGEFITRVNQIMSYLNEMDTKAATRVGMTREAYQQLIYNELWLSGTEAVKVKHADRLAKIRCDKSLLDGFRTEEVPTPFGVFEVKFSKCPLISGIFGIKRVEQQGFTQTYQVPKNEQEVMSEIKRAKRNVFMRY